MNTDGRENADGNGRGDVTSEQPVEEEARRTVGPDSASGAEGAGETHTIDGRPAMVCAVRFRNSADTHELLCRGLDLVPGDQVVAEGDRGTQLATVVRPPRPLDREPAGMRKILRRARPTDLRQAHSNRRKEFEAYAYCKERIKVRNLPMQLVRVEFLHTGSKAIFYFSADGRVDFRDLVRDLAQRFHIRVEMRQIGVRDAARMLGGVGACGRELCCASHLKQFAPVSIKMAKAQNLSLNPQKVSGVCGRLLCCLAYEYDTYHEAGKSMPKVNKRVMTPKGVGRVREVDVLKGVLKVQVGTGLLALERSEVRPLTKEEIDALNRGEELQPEDFGEADSNHEEIVNTPEDLEGRDESLDGKSRDRAKENRQARKKGKGRRRKGKRKKTGGDKRPQDSRNKKT